MRIVWIILVLLIAVGAAALWNEFHGPSDPDAPWLRDAAEAVSVSGTSGSGSIEAAPNHAATPDAPTTDTTPAARGNAASSLVDDLIAGRAARGVESAAGDSAGTPRTTPSAAPGEGLALGRDAAIKGATVAPGSIVRLDDGALRADDRFTIRGAGTREDPYRISWELLASATDTFQPRLGETTLPQRVAMLHDAWVRIEGYATFPVYSFDPTEMLMMLNQWDGCCIGVPPTPYDAIEVKLASAPGERKRQVAYFGAVEGKLSIEPYLIENWLVGLYLMSDARFTLDM